MSTNERRVMVGLARFEDQPDLPSADVPLELLELKFKRRDAA